MDNETNHAFMKMVNNNASNTCSRAQSHMGYFMEPVSRYHPTACNEYPWPNVEQRSRCFAKRRPITGAKVDTVPLELYSNVVDLESDLINRTRKLSKCDSRHLNPRDECRTCPHGQVCTKDACMKKLLKRGACPVDISELPDWASFV